MPPPFDWQTRGVISPPRDQGTCNACTAFAIGATLEAALAIAGRGPAAIDPGFIHTCVGHQGTITDPQVDCQTGGDLGVTLGRLKTGGCVPQTAASIYPCPVGRCTAPVTQVLADYAEITDAPSAARAIATNGPIAAELWIWKNFFDYRGETPTYVPDLASGGQQLHSICVIGFDALGWIVKNSFGLSWGKGGFATIGYGSCGLLAAPPPGAPLPCQAFSIELAPPATDALVS